MPGFFWQKFCALLINALKINLRRSGNRSPQRGQIGAFFIAAKAQSAFTFELGFMTNAD